MISERQLKEMHEIKKLAYQIIEKLHNFTYIEDEKIHLKINDFSSLGNKAKRVLEDMGIHYVDEIEKYTRQDFIFRKGVGEQTFKKIKDYALQHNIIIRERECQKK